MKRMVSSGVALSIALLVSVAALNYSEGGQKWSSKQVETLRSFWIGSLPETPEDPSNRYADDERAARLGHKLFFDKRLSSNGEVSCATCHLPNKDFQDGTPLATGVGTTGRRTMPIVGTAHSPWLFWDGRKDSQWSQALGPLESPVEHGGSRLLYAHVIADHYREEYEAIFGPLADLSGLPATGGPVQDPVQHAVWDSLAASDRAGVTLIFTNIGKAIAAYERTLRFGSSRFDRYVEAVLNGEAPGSMLSKDEIAGLKLFMEKGQCINCHNGPLFTDNHFHNTGIAARQGLGEDVGRALGAKQVLSDEFNCLSEYSDAEPEECSELRFMVAEGHELVRAYKPPTLRNVVGRGPFMHAGQIETITDVLRHYNEAPEAPAGHSELKPLKLSKKELAQMEAFLGTLTGPVEAPDGFLQDPFAEVASN